MDPKILKNNNFSNILSKQTIGTKVTLQVKLHKAFKFRNYDKRMVTSHKDTKLRTLTKELGSVKMTDEVCFEYRMRKLQKVLKLKDVNLTQLDGIPFQAQITYTALDGTPYLCVITKTFEISGDKAELEQDKNF